MTSCLGPSFLSHVGANSYFPAGKTQSVDVMNEQQNMPATRKGIDNVGGIWFRWTEELGFFNPVFRFPNLHTVSDVDSSMWVLIDY